MSRSDAARCPNCGRIVEVDFFNEIGDEVLCSSCDANLEITGRNPVRFRIIKKADVYDEYRDVNDYNDEDFE